MCVAENRVGKVEASATLTVRGKRPEMCNMIEPADWYLIKWASKLTIEIIDYTVFIITLRCLDLCLLYYSLK